MKCPKCGADNGIDQTICSCCSFELDNEYAEELSREIAKQKRAGVLRIINIVAAVLTVGISYYAIVVSLSAGLIAGIIYSVAGIRNHRIKKAGEESKKSVKLEVAVLCMFVFHFILAFAWCMDAPPIPNDYTVDDLLYPGAEFDGTWELLNSLVEVGSDHDAAVAIGLDSEDVKLVEDIRVDLSDPNISGTNRFLETKADVIEQLLEHSEKGRKVIEQLGGYDQVVDLSEPSFKYEVAFLRNIKYLFRINIAYSCLRSQRGESVPAAESLAEFDGVFRKLSVNARMLITKMICYAVINGDICAANYIVNDPQTSDEAIELLQEQFVPLSSEQMGLENSLVTEYLMLKTMLIKGISSDLREFLPLDKAPGQFLKINSSLRLYQNALNGLVERTGENLRNEELSVWPRFYPKFDVELDSESKLPIYYTLYNPICALTIEIVVPALGKVSEIKTKVWICDDLFQIVLAMRLGEAYSLKARAYGEEYVIDSERRIIYSPGPDKEPFTKDDIKLPINVELLNL